MSTDFLLEYITFLFTTKTVVTPKHLVLIASGKRTPSNLFTAEKNELQGLFNSSLQLDQSEWETSLNTLVQKKSLDKDGEMYQLSSYGLEKKKEFKRRYPFINQISTLTYSQTRKEFWNWFIFVTQIVSELSYRNSRYIPYISDNNKQMMIKKWLAAELTDTKELPQKWAEELSTFLEQIPEVYRYFILDQLTGHDIEGLTRRQLSQKYKLDSVEINISVIHLMDELHKQLKVLPSMNSLWLAVHAYCHNGLSESAWRSKQLLEQNHSISQVARIRKLKENTIKEHILENILVDQGKAVNQFIPETIYRTLIDMFEADPRLIYKEAQDHFEFLDFFWFRLVEIERMRVNKCR